MTALLIIAPVLATWLAYREMHRAIQAMRPDDVEPEPCPPVWEIIFVDRES